MATPPIRRVVVVGTGLIGTSIGLALRARDIDVRLRDRNLTAARRAATLGAGRLLRDGDPRADVCVIAVPPHVSPATLAAAQRHRLAATYTDVASAKLGVIAAAGRLDCDLDSYVPGHPMAGGERSGPDAARADLFVDRPWVLCPTPARPAALAAVCDLVRLCGGQPAIVEAGAHDRIMAEVSHVPHLVASAVAARFATADDAVLSLVGTGVRDLTRIAAGSPTLWTEIIEHNAGAVADVLAVVADELHTAAACLRDARSGRPGLATVTELLRRGCVGRRRMDTAADAAARVGQVGGEQAGRAEGERADATTRQ